MELDRLLKKYNYQLPEKLIAQKPARPRDSARLLVYSCKTGKAQVDIFKNLKKYLPKKAILVFNQTKVVPARLEVIKPTGGKAKILYISQDKNYLKFLSDKFLPPDSKIILQNRKTIIFDVVKKTGQFYFLKPNFPVSKTKLILEKYGKTPLPPYIKHSPLTEKQRREQYQSVFAKAGLSVAAPTASLHFTKQLVNSLKKEGLDARFVTLNVNMGTFAPLREEQLKSGLLHSETFEINDATMRALNECKKQGRPIIAVGTTVVRTLESAAEKKFLKLSTGSTELFIRPGYKFKFVDGIITNFHVPKSSLMMLVAAFIGREELLSLYRRAVQKKFRFFSFGDGMFLKK